MLEFISGNDKIIIYKIYENLPDWRNSYNESSFYIYFYYPLAQTKINYSDQEPMAIGDMELPTLPPFHNLE